MRAKQLALSTGWYAAVVAGLLITVLPIVWVLVSSFRPNQEIFRYITPLSLRTFSPEPLSFDAYAKVFAKGFGRSLFNTLFVTVITVSVGIIINSMAGLAFAKLQFPLKNVLFTLCVISFMIPFQAVAIPLFIFMNNLRWMNSYQALILPALSDGVVIFLFRQFFAGIPDALIDSAKIDGARWGNIYLHIIVPMSRSAIIGGGLILFFDIWLSFLWPLIINPDERFQVVQVSIAKFSTEFGLLWNQQFAASVITMLIPIVLLLPLQRYYVGALTGGEIKE